MTHLPSQLRYQLNKIKGLKHLHSFSAKCCIHIVQFSALELHQITSALCQIGHLPDMGRSCVFDDETATDRADHR